MTDDEVKDALAACMILLLPRIGKVGQGDATYRAAAALSKRWLGGGLRDLDAGLDRVGLAADVVRRAYLQLVTTELGPERAGGER